MQATIQYIKKELAELYQEPEVQGFTRNLIEAFCGWNYTQQIINKGVVLEKSEFEAIKNAVLRLKRFEPIQYILGETEFMGLKLKVNDSVLIPRPETEELVDWIVSTNSVEKPQFLDIGTGSGCISLALKNCIRKSKISAVDISEKALNVARQNAKIHNLEIQFYLTDILKWEKYLWEFYDVIVSNPPYVRELEKKEMLPNVLEFEPENALFVSNQDPLIFYRRITEFAQKYLVEGGKMFFEINEYLEGEMRQLLEKQGFVNIELKKDINGKNRMMVCRKK